MNYEPNDPLASLRIAAETAAFVTSQLVDADDGEERENALMEALDKLHRRGVITIDEAAQLAALFTETAGA